MSIVGTPDELSHSFAPLADGIYGGARASKLEQNLTHVVWQVELLTSWDSCTGQADLPLLQVAIQAKVTAHIARGTLGTCLTGGVHLSMPGAASPNAFLSWDASEAEAALAIGALGTEGNVSVQRSGDGHEVVIFDIIFLGGADIPLMEVRQSVTDTREPSM